jgi:hypothetical protein
MNIQKYMMQGLHMDIGEQKSKISGILFCSATVLIGTSVVDARSRNYETKAR